MALDKQLIQISFASGIDTKTDPKQLQGKLLQLQNGIFQTGLEIRKRNGYISIPNLSNGVGISSFNNELISLDGNSLFSYDSNGSLQFNKGSLQTIDLSISTVVRNAFEQTIQDSATNGTLQCFTWLDSSGSVNYSVFDVQTGQSIVNNQIMAATGTVAKVLALGSYFIIIYNDSVGPTLYYKAINIATPTTLGSAVTIASDINSDSIFDATIINNSIYIGYDSTSARISFYSLSSTLVLSSQTNFGSEHADSIALFGDASFNVWVAYYNGSVINVFVLSSTFSTVLGKTLLDTTTLISNITGIVTSTTATIYYELVNAAIVPGDPLNLVKVNTMTIGGTAGTPNVFNRGIGLASKVVNYNGIYYFLAAYQSNLQSTYFLFNQNGIIVGKLSESEGGGYTSVNILPELNLVGSGIFQTASLIKDSVTASAGTVITQTGVISAQFTFTNQAPSKFSLGNNLHICGAIMNMYDGATVTEHSFNVYPEGLYTTWNPAAPTYSGGIGIGISMASVNQFQYLGVYEWPDNEGQLHQSAPSIPITISVQQPILFTSGTGTLITNGNTITSFSGTAPTTGQYVNLADSGGRFNFPYNCTVVSNVGGTITLSAHHGLVGGSYSFMISDQPLSLYFFESPDPVVLGPVFSSINAFAGQILVPLPGTTSNFPPGTYVSPLPPEFTPASIVQTNNPPTGLGTTSMYYALDNLSIPINFPTLRLTRKQNVSLALYRTQVNGTLFYRTTSPINLIYNDPTVDYITITDTTADGDLIGNQELYTTGGDVENIAMQASNIATTFKSRALVVPSENKLSWMYSKQVIPGLPVEFNPLEFVENIDSKIVDITSFFAMDDKIIFFGPNFIFYVVGSGPTAAGTNNDFTDAQLISTDVGCMNQSSVVLTPIGLMFQSQKGIYLLDRSLQVSYIGFEVEGFNSQTVTNALLMETVNQVRFSLNSGVILVYDYFYKQWDEFVNLSVNDACIFQNNFTIISPSGQILTESPGTFTDNGNAVLLSLTSNWLQFDNIQGFQRVYEFLIFGKYKSPHTLNVNIYTDFNPTPVQQVQIPVLSDPAPLPYQFRIFPIQPKCQSMQFKIFETQTAPYGEGFSLSNIALIVGVKKGFNKVLATQSYS